MKIWITRQCTGSIHAGGLERLNVWFQEPIWVEALTVSEIESLPWENSILHGVGYHSWEGGHFHKLPGSSVSFGKLFGYGEGKEAHPNHIDGLSEYVWEKLNEHYGNNKFPGGWYEYEKEGKCNQRDFILKIELDINFKTNQQ